MTEHSGNLTAPPYPYEQAQYENNQAGQAGQENMAWDIKRGSYIWEDPASGVVYSWDTEKEQWVLDETTLEGQFADTLGETLPYNPEGESYDPAEGSDAISEDKKQPPPSQEKSTQQTGTEPSQNPTETTEAKDEKKKKRKRKQKKKEA
jgi:hypothetical protein